MFSLSVIFCFRVLLFIINLLYNSLIRIACGQNKHTKCKTSPDATAAKMPFLFCFSCFYDYNLQMYSKLRKVDKKYMTSKIQKITINNSIVVLIGDKRNQSIDEI